MAYSQCVLRGVPFHWTLTLIPQWALAVTILLVVFNIFDQYVFVKEDVETPGALAEDVQPHRRIHVQGGINVFYLMGVMGAAILSGYFGWPRGIQESIMLTMAVLSWYTTPRAVHHANHFHFHPIAEVAALFLGIFITMIPALENLHARAVSLDLKDPWQFFWMSGALSSFLDNAPTYRQVLGTNSIGVEFAGNFPDVTRGPTEAQIAAWRVLVKVLRARYDIPLARVYAHNWIDYKDARYCEGCELARLAREWGE